jgi:hypothetical protein
MSARDRGRSARPPIPREIVASVRPADWSPRRVERDFHRRLEEGATLCSAGSTRARPKRLLDYGYVPRFRVDLFDTTFYLSRVRQNEDVRFFVGYVAQPARRGNARIHARLFYKDVSLIWRAASHFVRSDSENWIGKGDIRAIRVKGEEIEVSDESTTDLPFELQDAFESLSAAARRVRYDIDAIPRVLRRAPDDRFEAYADFIGPRRRAQSDPRNLVNGGRPVARFTRAGEPDTLRFAAGFEPDFRRGLLEESTSKSSLYGGRLRRFRILSANERIQYLFFAGPHHVWIIPPQATTTELSSYGVRTIDVAADDDLSVPGWEYDGGADSGLAGVDQIPAGYAGEPNPRDPSRSDASLWLDNLPVIREFRRVVLGHSPTRGARR